MEITRTKIPDVLILEPKIFEDERGFFMESFNQIEFENTIGRKVEFVQVNHSKSKKNVLRGLPFQLPPKAQGKLVRVIKGKVFDVVVDIRKESKTYLKWVGVELSEENRKQLWIPEGFANGFLAMTEDTEFLYETSNYYAPDLERTISWNHPRLNIKWPDQVEIIQSKKDLINEYDLNLIENLTN